MKSLTEILWLKPRAFQIRSVHQFKNPLLGRSLLLAVAVSVVGLLNSSQSHASSPTNDCIVFDQIGFNANPIIEPWIIIQVLDSGGNPASGADVTDQIYAGYTGLNVDHGLDIELFQCCEVVELVLAGGTPDVAATALDAGGNILDVGVKPVGGGALFALP